VLLELDLAANIEFNVEFDCTTINWGEKFDGLAWRTFLIDENIGCRL